VNAHRLLVVALAVAALCGVGARVAAAADADAPPRQKWSFAGPLGMFDQAQLQRGFKIYREVCQNCHSLKLVAFRNLADAGGPGFSAAQAATVAGEYKIKDGPNDQGEMFERPGRVGDYFPAPFANEQAARAANGGALPPDLSVIAKARSYERGFPWFLLDMFTQYQETGPDYIAAIINGYENPPAGFKMPGGAQYNAYFPGHAIGMPKPLDPGQVEYSDGTPATIQQYGRDVAAFLMWTAEPSLDARKRLGLQVMIFLIVFAGLLYFTKKRVWHQVELHPEEQRPRPPTEYKRN
jgi:ubiquinol-cytochrome c reductase cytochrome b/c1 subunit